MGFYERLCLCMQDPNWPVVINGFKMTIRLKEVVDINDTPFASHYEYQGLPMIVTKDIIEIPDDVIDKSLFVVVFYWCSWGGLDNNGNSADYIHIEEASTKKILFIDN